MTSDEIVESLEELPEETQELEAAAKEDCERFFIFSVGDSQFALPPSAIREIVSDLEVFPLPNCPPYIPGLINCHGTPHTVFDLRVLFESERQQAQQFLILNVADDCVAFGCTEVVEIAEIPKSQISTFSEKDTEARFCASLFNFSGRRILVLSVEHILGKLENDLG
jgi:purine-binding chemotaxis protein CheW